MYKRILFSDNGTLTDYTTNVTNYHDGTETFTLVAAEDYIYIGARLPFNHLYFKLGSVVNSNASVMSIQYWDSIDWRDAVEVIDETSDGGASFGQSGFVTWVPDKSYGWIREDTNYGGNTVDGLNSVTIYDHYWMRIKFSADLSAGVELSWVGQIFANDDDLGVEYSDLARSAMLDAFKSGKTNWQSQHVTAAYLITEDLINRKIIWRPEQILRREEFRNAAVSKVAEIIFNGLGDDYKDDKMDAIKNYNSRMGKLLPTVDTNINGREEPQEKFTQGSLYR